MTMKIGHSDVKEMIKVRKSSLQDAKGVVAVINSVIAEGKLTVLDKSFTVQEEVKFLASLSDREAVFVAEVGGKIVGVQTISFYSQMDANSHVATIGTWIHKDYRSRGVGKLLAKESFTFAKEKRFEKILIYVMAHNERALRFYESLGFKRIGTAKRQVKLRGEYHDEVYMEKFL